MARYGAREVNEVNDDCAVSERSKRRFLLLGTQNRGKIKEATELLAGVANLELLTFADVPFSDVRETGTTFLENAVLKATAISRETGLPVLSDDSGLAVHALNGAPGVLSARFAGDPSTTAANNKLLVERLDGITDRRAYFITVAALVLKDGQIFVCSGILHGAITNAPSGNMGFGYDPLFVPSGEIRTLAEMTLEEKNHISHRHKALSRMTGILQDLICNRELTSAIE